MGHTIRVENGSTDAGTPDTNICIEGVEFWMELKRQETFQIKATQISWSLRRTRNGGNVFIVCKMRNGELYIWDAKHSIRMLFEAQKPINPEYTLSRNDWKELPELLLSLCQ